MRYRTFLDQLLNFQQPWQLVHRVHLHQALKRMAIEEAGKGQPAELFTSSRAVEVDCEQATIHLRSGEVVQGDIVICADGVHVCLRGQ